MHDDNPDREEDNYSEDDFEDSMKKDTQQIVNNLEAEYNDNMNKSRKSQMSQNQSLKDNDGEI